MANSDIPDTGKVLIINAGFVTRVLSSSQIDAVEDFEPMPETTFDQNNTWFKTDRLVSMAFIFVVSGPTLSDS